MKVRVEISGRTAIVNVDRRGLQGDYTSPRVNEAFDVAEQPGVRVPGVVLCTGRRVARGGTVYMMRWI